MTDKQAELLHAEVDSMKVLLFAVIKSAPNLAALRTAFQAQRELAETAWLNSALPEESLQLKKRKLDQLASVLFE